MINIIYKFLSLLRNQTHIKAKKDYEREKSIYVAGYPISGSSWIAYLISYIFNCKYYDIDAIEWSKQRLSLKKYLTGKNKHAGTQLFNNIYKTHEKPDLLPNTNQDIIIYVVRDVRDVSNSYFHRFEKVYGTLNKNTPILKNYIYYCFQKIVPFKYRYKFMIRFFAFEWSVHVNQVFKNDNILVISYEDIIDRPIKVLKKIINKIDSTSWNQDVTIDAVDKFSLKNMRKAAKKTTKDVIKTDRVGSYGDWKNYFSIQDKLFFEKKYIPIMNQIYKRNNP